MDKKSIYFPNLNGLRFIASMMVLFPHIEQFKLMRNMDNFLSYYPYETGGLGVTLFFVLSGFLITYLLLAEEQYFKAINIRKFYLRRILRIWPLYFLIIMLAFLILPNLAIFTFPDFGKDVVYKHLLIKLILFAVFLPNLLSVLTTIPYATHTWSIGTEEQFYLIWPVVLKYFKKHRLMIMFIIILLYFLFYFLFKSDSLKCIPGIENIDAFWSNSFKIECMAIGGVYAILLFQKHRILKLLLNHHLCWATIIITLLLFLNSVHVPYVFTDIYAVLFGIIILNFAANDTFKLSLENRWLNYLGKISYGLYMYHPIGVGLALGLCIYVKLTTNWLLYPLSFILTLALAAFSYTYFEAFFLRFKNRFSNVVTGNEIKE